jgi:hypothetical protein
MPHQLKVRLLAALVVAGCVSSVPTTPPVPEPEPASLSIGYGSARAIAVHLGVDFEVPVTLLSEDGDTLPIPPALRVESRNPAVISVDSGSFINARTMGAAWIVASLVSNGRTLADSLEVRVVCTLELRVHITPTERTLTVGESFTPTISLSTCGGRIPVEDTFRWRANDTTVVQIDSVSGLTTGRRSGATWILVSGARHNGLGIISVTVTDN